MNCHSLRVAEINAIIIHIVFYLVQFLSLLKLFQMSQSFDFFPFLQSHHKNLSCNLSGTHYVTDCGECFFRELPLRDLKICFRFVKGCGCDGLVIIH